MGSVIRVALWEFKNGTDIHDRQDIRLRLSVHDSFLYYKLPERLQTLFA